MWSSGWTLRNYLFPNFPMCRFEIILDEETSLVHTAISGAICVNSKYLEQCLAHRRCSVWARMMMAKGMMTIPAPKELT